MAAVQWITLSPLTPEGVGARVEGVLQLEAGAQGGHVAPAGSSSPQQTVRGGGGGRQGAAAVAGGWRHQLPHKPHQGPRSAVFSRRTAGGSYIPQRCTSIPPGWKPLRRTWACPERGGERTLVYFRFNAEQSIICFPQQTDNTSLRHPSRSFFFFFCPPTHEAKVYSASKAVLRSVASLWKNKHGHAVQLCILR